MNASLWVKYVLSVLLLCVFAVFLAACGSQTVAWVDSSSTSMEEEESVPEAYSLPESREPSSAPEEISSQESSEPVSSQAAASSEASKSSAPSSSKAASSSKASSSKASSQAASSKPASSAASSSKKSGGIQETIIDPDSEEEIAKTEPAIWMVYTIRFPNSNSCTIKLSGSENYYISEVYTTKMESAKKDVTPKASLSYTRSEAIVTVNVVGDYYVRVEAVNLKDSSDIVYLDTYIQAISQ